MKQIIRNIDKWRMSLAIVVLALVISLGLIVYLIAVGYKPVAIESTAPVQNASSITTRWRYFHFYSSEQEQQRILENYIVQVSPAFEYKVYIGSEHNRVYHLMKPKKEEFTNEYNTLMAEELTYEEILQKHVSKRPILIVENTGTLQPDTQYTITFKPRNGFMSLLRPKDRYVYRFTTTKESEDEKDIQKRKFESSWSSYLSSLARERRKEECPLDALSNKRYKSIFIELVVCDFRKNQNRVLVLYTKDNDQALIDMKDLLLKESIPFDEYEYVFIKDDDKYNIEDYIDIKGQDIVIKNDVVTTRVDQ